VQQVLVTVDDGPVPFHPDPDVRAAVGMFPDQPRGGQHDRLQIHRHELGRAHPGEIQKLGEQATEPVALAHHQIREVTVILVGMGRARKLLHRTPDRGQRVADLVGEGRGEGRDRLEAFRPEIQFVETLQVGNIREYRRHRGTTVRVPLEGGGRQADGEAPAIHQRHGSLATADLPPVPERGDHRRPQLRRPELEGIEDRCAGQGLAIELQHVGSNGVDECQGAVVVHGHDARSNVPQDLVRREAHAAQLALERRPFRALGPEPRGEDADQQIGGEETRSAPQIEASRAPTPRLGGVGRRNQSVAGPVNGSSSA
jgi:hypothetical protein